MIRDRIVELGLDENTLIWFFSDNGDAPQTATGSPQLRGHKGSVYEGGHRVPAIAWWPGRIEPGSITDALGITLDVMPTILSIANIEPHLNRALDGIDISSVLFKQTGLPARPLCWADLSNGGRRSEAMRDGIWKLIVQHPNAKEGTFENEAIELYRLDRYLSEANDLAQTKRQDARPIKSLVRRHRANSNLATRRMAQHRYDRQRIQQAVSGIQKRKTGLVS
ncbi:MAG: arylsulfatase A [Candidatus Pelagisphaera sp.]|jgi:arylsulfatase A